MKSLRFSAIVLAGLLAACSTVSTRVVKLNPALELAPTANVEVLLEKPQRAHIEVAFLESRGASEADMLNDAREKARALGADAIVKTGIEREYQPPMTVYDPWYDPFFWGYYRYGPYPPFPHPWGPYHVVGGTYSYVLKAVAIKYRD